MDRTRLALGGILKYVPLVTVRNHHNVRIFRWGSNHYVKVSDFNFVRQKKYSQGCKGIFVTCSFLLLRRESLLPVLIKSTFNTFSTVLPDQAAQISGPFSNIRMILLHNFVSQLEDNVTTHPFSSCFAGLSVPAVFHRDAPVPLLPSRNLVQFRNQCDFQLSWQKSRTESSSGGRGSNACSPT